MRTKYFFVTLLSILIVFGAFFAVRVSSPDVKEEIITPPSVKEERQSQIVPQKTDSTKYFLTLEGKNLCAYTEKLGNRELILSRSAEPMLMSEEEKRALEGGIYAESFEDLCLYFEAYLS